MIKTAVADEQVLFREMLSMVLSSDGDIEIAGLASNGDELLDICCEKKPDVVIVDIKMPVRDGFFALEAIKKEKVIVLTSFEDERSALEAYKKGANGYVLKDIKPSALKGAIKCVFEGLVVVQDEIAELVRKQIELPAARKPVASGGYEQYGLDALDVKIIKLLVEGKSNKEIGEALNYSEGSIKNRISRILGATGLKDRTQIAVFALQNHIV